MIKRNTRLPRDLSNGIGGNPTDPKLIETMCFTRNLDSWFVEKRDVDKRFWGDLGVDSPTMYFGSKNGAFRIFPARHSNNCGEYDPRIRPWYVAGSSGPKNIIMILDISGSIDDIRLSLLKQAAIRVVQTLTVQDRITIIPFATSASRITDNGYMYRATAKNIDILINRINALQSGGRTNFYAAFKEAFDVFDATINQEFNANCNSAVLFFTDGVRTEGPTESEVTQMLQQRIDAVKPRLLDKPIFLFSYSISQDSLVHEYPSRVACAVEQGVWSRISNDDEIIPSLSSYYELFALGVGSDRNADFVAWVEPYQYDSEDRFGTTVSVPVYDRSQSPHIFLGVVGIDIPLAALDAALGSTTAGAQVIRTESINRIISSNRVICPVLDLNTCELESFRRLSMPDGTADCNDVVDNNCTSGQFVQVTEEECPGRPDYPRTFWANQDVADVDHLSRTCCKIGDTTASSTCPLAGGSKTDDSKTTKSGVIVGGSIGGYILLLALLCKCYCWDKPNINKPRPVVQKKEKNYDHYHTARAEQAGFTNLVPVPPPTNPLFKVDPYSSASASASAPEAAGTVVKQV